ncbi:o-succinylbenzoate synthase [Propioniciclava soli]|uniref:o-succinylbenzoate synthase n=1 Tax=Propioniciclava soli TaxID=2775081 RepID=UPI001E53721E|nr:o-succinylbenzoate synthase [Propioniciclava soli]
MIAVYSTALTLPFRGLTSRDGVLLRGPAGWGEFSPFWEYDDAPCVPWLRAAVEAATQAFPDPLRDRVAVNVTVPAVDAATARGIVARSGCGTAKVKVAQAGQSLADDLDRVAAVRDALGPAGHLRVDANAAWSLDDARRALPALDRAARGLQYAEQPVAAVADLARLRRAVGVPLAADESIRRAADPYEVKRLDAADVVVLKVQPLGGVRACLRLAHDIGIPVVVSSALESSVGIAAGVALAAALPGIGLASGLATVQLFATPVTSEPLLPTDGYLPIVRVTPDRIPPADPALTARWHERLGRVARLAGIDLAAVLQ